MESANLYFDEIFDEFQTPTSDVTSPPPPLQITIITSNEIFDELFLSNNSSKISLSAHRVGGYIYLQSIHQNNTNFISIQCTVQTIPSSSYPILPFIPPTLHSNSYNDDTIEYNNYTVNDTSTTTTDECTGVLHTSKILDDTWKILDDTSNNFERSATVDIVDWYHLPDISAVYFGRSCHTTMNDVYNCINISTVQQDEAVFSPSLSYFSHAFATNLSDQLSTTLPHNTETSQMVECCISTVNKKDCVCLPTVVTPPSHPLLMISSLLPLPPSLTLTGDPSPHPLHINSSTSSIPSNVTSEVNTTSRDSPLNTSSLNISEYNFSKSYKVITDTSTQHTPISPSLTSYFTIFDSPIRSTSTNCRAFAHNTSNSPLNQLCKFFYEELGGSRIQSESVGVLWICNPNVFAAQDVTTLQSFRLCRMRNIKQIFVLLTKQDEELIAVRGISTSDLTNVSSLLKDMQLLRLPRGGLHDISSDSLEVPVVCTTNRAASTTHSVKCSDTSTEDCISCTRDSSEEDEVDLINTSTLQLLDLLTKETDNPSTLGSSLYIYRRESDDSLYFIPMDPSPLEDDVLFPLHTSPISDGVAHTTAPPSFSDSYKHGTPPCHPYMVHSLQRYPTLSNEMSVFNTQQLIALWTALLCFQASVVLSSQPTKTHPSTSSYEIPSNNKQHQRMKNRGGSEADVLPFTFIEKAVPIDHGMGEGQYTAEAPDASRNIQIRQLLMRSIKNWMFVCGSNKNLLMDVFLLDKSIIYHIAALLGSAYEYLGDTYLFEVEESHGHAYMNEEEEVSNQYKCTAMNGIHMTPPSTFVNATPNSLHVAITNNISTSLIKALRSYFMVLFYLQWRKEKAVQYSGIECNYMIGGGHVIELKKQLKALQNRVLKKLIRCFMRLITTYLAFPTINGLGNAFCYLLILSSFLNNPNASNILYDTLHNSTLSSFFNTVTLASVLHTMGDVYGHLSYKWISLSTFDFMFSQTQIAEMIDKYRMDFNNNPFIRLFSKSQEPLSCVGSYLKATVFTGNPILPLDAKQIVSDIEANLNDGVTCYLKALRLISKHWLQNDALLSTTFVPTVKLRLARAYDALRRWYTSSGRFTKAIIHCKQGVELFEAIGDRVSGAYMQYAMATLKLKESSLKLFTPLTDAPLLTEEDFQIAVICISALQASYEYLKLQYDATHSLKGCTYSSISSLLNQNPYNSFDANLLVDECMYPMTCDCVCAQLCHALSLYLGRLHIRIARTYVSSVALLCDATNVLYNNKSTCLRRYSVHETPIEMSHFRLWVGPFGCVEAICRYMCCKKDERSSMQLKGPDEKDEQLIEMAMKHLHQSLELVKSQYHLYALAHFYIGCIHLREATLRSTGYIQNKKSSTANQLKLKHVLNAAARHLQSSIHFFHLFFPPNLLNSKNCQQQSRDSSVGVAASSICETCHCKHVDVCAYDIDGSKRWTWFFISACIVLRATFQLLQSYPSLFNPKGGSKQQMLISSLKAMSNLSDLLPCLEGPRNSIAVSTLLISLPSNDTASTFNLPHHLQEESNYLLSYLTDELSAVLLNLVLMESSQSHAHTDYKSLYREYLKCCVWNCSHAATANNKQKMNGEAGLVAILTFLQNLRFQLNSNA